MLHIMRGIMHRAIFTPKSTFYQNCFSKYYARIMPSRLFFYAGDYARHYAQLAGIMHGVRNTHIEARSRQPKASTGKEKGNNCEVQRRRGAAARQSQKQYARCNLGLACSSQNLIHGHRFQQAVTKRPEQASERRRIEARRDTQRDNRNMASNGEPTATGCLRGWHESCCMLSCIIPGIIPGIMPCIMPCITQIALKK